MFPLAGTDPVFFQSTGGFRGYKQDLYEGGIHTPLIARWPGKIKAGQPRPITSPPSGISCRPWPNSSGAPAPADTDGISYLPTLLGQPGQKTARFPLLGIPEPGRARGRAHGRLESGLQWNEEEPERALSNSTISPPTARSRRTSPKNIPISSPRRAKSSPANIRPVPIKEWNFLTPNGRDVPAHPLVKLDISSMRFLAFLACCRPRLLRAFAEDKPKPIHALMVCGGCCHDYENQKKILSEGISQAGQCRMDHRLRRHGSRASREHLRKAGLGEGLRRRAAQRVLRFREGQ